MEYQYILESVQLLQKDFDLPSPHESISREELIALLEPVVRQLLDRDFERLLQICYRVDLGEVRLKQILHESNPEQMSRELSEALVNRQIQKIEIRKRYQ
ncbi:hypothetical protein KZP23_09250 [Echinicola marina]|uniref:hypothetical protein n=1 Tax=Echinicola marina TaxID=2859768 RepID=UPI001CF6E52B|nr:hypothetical protein [Echinicola marina]UCS95172.1 hypothetical protein KZP23_09250 [Echinicola marina]